MRSFCRGGQPFDFDSGLRLDISQHATSLRVFINSHIFEHLQNPEQCRSFMCSSDRLRTRSHSFPAFLKRANNSQQNKKTC